LTASAQLETPTRKLSSSEKAKKTAPHLHFNSDGKFKIVQLTDLHYGESLETDHHTDLAIKTLLDYEKPDFVANTGDVLSGYNWNKIDADWAKTRYSRMIDTLTELGCPWATTLGNHDH